MQKLVLGIILVLVFAAVSGTAVGSPGDCAIRAKMHPYGDFDVVLNLDGTWQLAFSTGAELSDFAEILCSLSYFPATHALGDPAYAVPEHLTVRMILSSIGTETIVQVTYDLAFFDRFGTQVQNVTGLTTSIPTRPGEESTAVFHWVPYYRDTLISEAANGMLEARAHVTSLVFANGFELSGRFAPYNVGADGQLVYTEAENRVKLFPNGIWEYENPPIPNRGEIVELRSVQMEYYGPGRSATDDSYSVPAHVNVSITVQNVGDQPLLGVELFVKCRGLSQLDVESSWFDKPFELRDTILPGEERTVYWNIDAPSSNLVDAIATGRVMFFLALGRIAIAEQEILPSTSTFYLQALCANVEAHGVLDVEVAP